MGGPITTGDRGTAAGGAPSPLDFLPARWMPLLYIGFAHLSLITAFTIVAVDPRGVGGFFYHPRLVAAVHLVTLGWISGSILGSLYLVCPLAFRMALPAGRGDYAAFASFVVGVTGMVVHFRIAELSGMAWSAGLVVAAFAFVGGRVLRGLRHAPVPAVARLPVALAIVNLLAAALVGILLGLNKTHPVLPVSQLQAVLGHAHLATLGWAVMMVMGAGYRLLPMVLPAAMPRGPWPHVGTVLTQAGAWGLFLGFLSGGRAVPAAACLAAAGIAVFLGQVAWMARHRRPAPAERPRPDLSLGHVVQGLACLTATMVIGIGLAFAPPSDTALRWVMAYGTVALVGFPSHMVLGVAGRLLPLYGWLWGFADRGHKVLPPSLHRATSRGVQALVLLIWTAGVPGLAAGLAFDQAWLIGPAAGTLAVGAGLAAANLGLGLHRLWRDTAPTASPQA